MLWLGDVFFTVFHTALILFNLFGWALPRWRKWHIGSLLITFGSWGVLGYFKGWGYCPCTDWHWQILHARGIYDLPNSYISYLVVRLTGVSLPASLVDIATLAGAILALMISTVLYLRNKRARSRK
jgi:hypothetical protein